MTKSDKSQSNPELYSVLRPNESLKVKRIHADRLHFNSSSVAEKEFKYCWETVCESTVHQQLSQSFSNMFEFRLLTLSSECILLVSRLLSNYQLKGQMGKKGHKSQSPFDLFTSSPVLKTQMSAIPPATFQPVLQWISAMPSQQHNKVIAKKNQQSNIVRHATIALTHCSNSSQTTKCPATA